MTVLNSYQPVKVDWDGEQLGFFFPFEILGVEPFEFWVETEREARPGTYRRRKLNASDYILTINSGSPTSLGGAVVVNEDAIPETIDRISLERNTHISQKVDLKNTQRFRVEDLEYVLDRLTMIVQEKLARVCGLENQIQPLQLINYDAYTPLTTKSVNDPLELIAFWCNALLSLGQNCSGINTTKVDHSIVLSGLVTPSNFPSIVSDITVAAPINPGDASGGTYAFDGLDGDDTVGGQDVSLYAPTGADILFVGGQNGYRFTLDTVTNLVVTPLSCALGLCTDRIECNMSGKVYGPRWPDGHVYNAEYYLYGASLDGGGVPEPGTRSASYSFTAHVKDTPK